MAASFRSRIAGAWNVLVKGSLFPFNKAYSDGEIGAASLNRPFSKSPWVQRAIKHCSGPIAAVPLKFTLDGRGGEQEVEDAAMEAFWARPAKGLTFHDWVEATVGWLKLTGEAFWILDDSWLLPFPPRFEPFMVVRPDQMRPVLEGEELMGWVYRSKSGRQVSLVPQQVVHLRNWNPDDDIRGASEYGAAECAAEADYLACLYNRNLMKNNGDQGPIIVGKSGIPSDAQREQIIQQLREKRARAQRGVFAPIFLTGDITVEDPKIQATDANFVQQRLHNRHEVFIAFGVPPSMADITASYSIGSASDRFRLIEDTCMPLADKIADHAEALARRMLQREVSAWFDWDEHTVLQQVRSERIDSAQKLWQMGVSLADINDYLRMGMKPFLGWEVGYLPFSVAPVGQGLNPDRDPNMGEPPDREEEEEMDEETAKSHGRLSKMFRPRLEQKAPSEPAEQFQEHRTRRELAQWRSHMAQRAAIVGAYETKFKEALNIARAEVLKRLRAADLTKAHTKSAAGDFIFDRVKFLQGLIFEMRKVSRQALQAAGEQVWRELSRDDPYEVPDADVLRFHRQRDNRIEGAGQEVFEELQDTLEEGIHAGESLEELSERVRGTFNGISKRHANTIALTETAAAYGQGRQSAMEKAGVRQKMWLTSGNANVRDAHRAANHQVVDLDKPFNVGGESLMHPGDPSGSPGNVINCHCVSIPVEAQS